MYAENYGVVRASEVLAWKRVTKVMAANTLEKSIPRVLVQRGEEKIISWIYWPPV